MKLKNYFNRIEALKSCFSKWEVEGVLIENPLDLYYLTGLQLSKGSLVVLKEVICLFVDGRYIEFAQIHSPFPTQLLEKEALCAYVKSITSLGFDSDLTSVARKEELDSIHSSIKAIPGMLYFIRSIKDNIEIEKLKKSAQLLWKGFEYIKKKLKVGIQELEISTLFELFCRKNGAEKLSFDPIIAFGKNTAYPHYRPRNIALKRGDIVLFDLGVVVDHYHSDMTRTFFFGKGDPRLLAMHKVVLQAHSEALKYCRSGVAIGKLDQVANDIMKKMGYEKFLSHSLGHGIGLETHEYPRLSEKGKDKSNPLKEGMAITIEPGLYMPDIGGIRHEDTIIITKNGYENLYSYEE